MIFNYLYSQNFSLHVAELVGDCIYCLIRWVWYHSTTLLRIIFIIMRRGIGGVLQSCGFVRLFFPILIRNEPLSHCIPVAYSVMHTPCVGHAWETLSMFLNMANYHNSFIISYLQSFANCHAHVKSLGYCGAIYMYNQIARAQNQNSVPEIQKLL